MANSSTETGRQAERAAVVYLEMRGYEILEQNWRRPRCEIDIVAKKDNIIFLVEVKYRRDNQQGGGLEAITAAKLKQMNYAANSWAEESKWTGEYQLSAVEIAGPNFSVMSFIDSVF